MNKIEIFAFLSVLANTWLISDGAKILFLSPTGSRSHKIFFMSISRALAEKDHHVTMVSAFKESQPTKNIRDVILPSTNVSSFLTDIFNRDSVTKHFLRDAPNLCVNALGMEEVQNLKKEKFDLVILSVAFNNCFLSLVHHFQVPFIYASASALLSPFSEMIGNVEFPSLFPNKLMEAIFPLTFYQRFLSVTSHMLLWIMFPLYMEPRMESLCRERGLCSADMPSFSEMNKNTSLVIMNIVRTLEWPPRPVMPNIIYVGGAHILPAKNLSQDLESWVEASGEDGFIFFSLGSVVSPSVMPEKCRKVFINVFRSLKQRVLWKWDEKSMADLPVNVKLAKWLPQQDILGHPKLKLFITHGGLLSTMEATYHGVPMIGLPVFGDQFSNVKKVAKEGWGRLVTWNELEETTLRNSILELIEHKNVESILRHRSSVMRDRPLEPTDEAVFWIEYVLKHKGARHLMSPIVNMTWLQLYNIDIWTVIVATGLSVIYFLFRIIKYLLRKMLFGSMKKCKKKK